MRMPHAAPRCPHNSLHIRRRLPPWLRPAIVGAGVCFSMLASAPLRAQPLALSGQQAIWQQALSDRHGFTHLPLSTSPLAQPEQRRCLDRLLPAVAIGSLGGAVLGWLVWFGTLGALYSDRNNASRDGRKAALIGAGVGTTVMVAGWAWECRHPRQPTYGPRWDPRGQQGRDSAPS